jgi:hypothetical protein
MLFNTVGYMYVLNWRQGELARKAKELIDTHASEISGNLIFTLPMQGPTKDSKDYNSNEYTRIDGEIKFEGIMYRMVKQKIHNNLLYVVCVNDKATQIATEEVNAIISAVSGQPDKESTPGAMKVINSLLKYCSLSTTMANGGNTGWCRKVVFANNEETYLYNGSRSLFHPPSIG